MRAACVTRVHEINASIFSLLATHGITLTPLKPLGAAVRGLDLRKTPPEPVLDALQQAMATRGFLVFKDQGVLTGAEQVYASCFWGAREMHSTHGVHPKAPNKHIFRLSNDRSVGILGVGPQWHNDGSFMQDVFSHVGYHIVRVAEGGGGTIFAHQGGAFDALPPEEQARANGHCDDIDDDDDHHHHLPLDHLPLDHLPPLLTTERRSGGSAS